MSLFGSINTLGTALRTFSYGLDVSTNNTNNALTPGYSRQVLNLEPGFPLQDGPLQLGGGVNAQSVARIRDLFLDTQIRTQYSGLGRASVRQEALTELAAIFPEVKAAADLAAATTPAQIAAANALATMGLKGAIDNVATAWANLGATPGSVALQTAVRDSLKALADMLQMDARKVFDLQVNLDDQVKTTVDQINTLTDQIASLNQQIKLSTGKAQGNAPDALLDLREQAAEKLAKLIDAHFTLVGDGSMVVSFNGGVLADGNQAKHLATKSSTTDPGRTGIGYYQTPLGSPFDVTAQIRGGKLGGLLSARDGEVEKARLDLNRVAFGIISRSNEINESFVAGDLTTSHDLFSGTSAADIVLNPIVNANPGYVGDTRDAAAPGDLAKMQAQIKNFIQFSSMRTTNGNSIGVVPINPAASIQSQIANFNAAPTASAAPASGRMVISTGGNAVPIDWDLTMSINDIIRVINTQGAGAFYATFDNTTQKLILVGQTPLTVYDVTADLADVLMISSVVTSSAPINNYPVPGTTTGLQVDNVGALNNTQNTLDLFTTASPTGGTILIDGVPMNWVATDQISGSLFFAVQGNNPSPGVVILTWDPNTQTVRLEKSGDPFGANAGVHGWPANSMTGIQVVDQVGNLARVLNLDTNTNGSKILDEMVVALGARKDAEATLVQQDQALVDQTQQLQDNESKVDLNQEMAQARLFQRSYEASVRLQAIMDEMLNVLINHTGTASSASSSV